MLNNYDIKKYVNIPNVFGFEVEPQRVRKTMFEFDIRTMGYGMCDIILRNAYFRRVCNVVVHDVMRYCDACVTIITV